MQLDPDEMTHVINRIKRAQGQLGGVLRMLEEGVASAADIQMKLPIDQVLVYPQSAEISRRAEVAISCGYSCGRAYRGTLQASLSPIANPKRRARCGGPSSMYGSCRSSIGISSWL